MKHFIYALNFSLLLFLFLVLPTAGQATKPAKDVSEDEIDKFLQAQMTKNQIPGLSVAIVRNGQIIKLKSYGVANLEWNQPATPQTAFQIASSTKPFTGTALMMLVEEGRLSLDDKISKYLPDAPAAWKDITIRQLATHSSGITNAVPAKPDASLEEFIKTAYPLPLDYEPGAKAAYGLTDFVVLTYIIEKVSGLTFPDFLKTKLLDRFQMTDSQFEFATEIGDRHYANVIKNRATVYQREGDRQKIYWYLYPPRTYSAGGLFSTAADIAKFAVAFDEGKVLSAKSLEQMWRRDRLGDGSLNGFGVGWVAGEYNGRKIVGHSGGPALGDILRFPDEKLTIVVLSNEQRLYPYLAKGVADFYFPPAPVGEVKGIADADAELTGIVKKFLDDGMRDRLDSDLFGEKAKQGFVPGFRVFGLPFFASLAPRRSLVLLEHTENQGVITRRYRAVHGKKAVLWIFEFDKDRKILSIDSNQQ
jgi:CubicO group peptidase (beta-lactamase class C family)